MRVRKNKNITDEKLEWWKKQPFMPLYAASAICGVSRNTFDDIFGHLIQPIETKAKRKTILYITEHVLNLPKVIKTQPLTPTPKKQKPQFDIKALMEKNYAEIKRERAA